MTELVENKEFEMGAKRPDDNSPRRMESEASAGFKNKSGMVGDNFKDFRGKNFIQMRVFCGNAKVLWGLIRVHAVDLFRMCFAIRKPLRFFT